MRLKPYHLLSIALLFVGLFMLVYPHEGTASAARGISIWWDVLFPSLFPFFVISEMMFGFGLVHFFGKLLDPFMRPLFRVPGIGGFVVAMGFASGYPMAAKLTSQLWDQELVSREEGERLVAFTTTSDPIFLIGAVSVGFFHDVRLAVVLAAAHYGTAMLIGLLMRFYGSRTKPDAKNVPVKPPVHQSPVSGRQQPGRLQRQPGLLSQAFAAMHEARLADSRPIGTMLKQAIRSAIQMIMVIGGLVVFFSVVLEAMRVSGLLSHIVSAIGGILELFGMPGPLAESIVSGLFEVTLGAKSAGMAATSIPLIYKAAAGVFILSWAGFCVHAQIVSILYRTPFRYTPFVIARLAHGILSSIALLLLWEKLKPDANAAMQVFSPSASPVRLEWGAALPASILVFTAAAAALIALATIVAFGRRLRSLFE